MATHSQSATTHKCLYEAVKRIDRAISCLLQKRSDLCKQIDACESAELAQACVNDQADQEILEARRAAHDSAQALQSMLQLACLPQSPEAADAKTSCQTQSDCDAGALYLAMSFAEW